MDFFGQLIGSAVAVAALVGLSAWARIARPVPPLGADQARELLAEEFPDVAPSALWIAPDGRAAVGRDQDTALVLVCCGDGYLARALPWDAVGAQGVEAGRVVIATGDIAAPRLVLTTDAWPPAELQAPSLEAAA